MLRTLAEKAESFQQVVLRKLDSHILENEARISSLSTYKKQAKVLKSKTGNYENTRENKTCLEGWYGQGFVSIRFQKQRDKSKNRQIVLQKTKSLLQQRK